MNISINKYKWWLLLFVCVALINACEKQPASTQKPISFGDRKNITPIDGQNGLIWGYFGDTWVYGEKSGDDFIGKNAVVSTVGSGSLTPSVTRYWVDTEDDYNFYSLYPYDGKTVTNAKLTKTNTDNTETVALSFTYSDITSQTDICVAGTPKESQYGKSTPDAVHLNYTHVLSQLKFQAQSTIETMPIRLTKIELTNLVKGATFTITKLGEKQVDLNGDAEGGEVNCYTFTTIPAFLTENNNIVTIGTDDEPYTINNIEDNVATCIVIPESNDNTNRPIHITVTYDVLNPEDLDGAPIETNKTSDNYIPACKWLSGTSYLYTLNITPSQPIVFGTVEVRDWENGGEEPVQF